MNNDIYENIFRNLLFYELTEPELHIAVKFKTVCKSWNIMVKAYLKFKSFQMGNLTYLVKLDDSYCLSIHRGVYVRKVYPLRPSIYVERGKERRRLLVPFPRNTLRTPISGEEYQEKEIFNEKNLS